MIPDGTDLEDLRRRLATQFESMPPVGYVRGKGALRAAVIGILECSELEAEDLVDTLESRGLIRYEGDPSKVDRLECRWRLE